MQCLHEVLSAILAEAGRELNPRASNHDDQTESAFVWAVGASLGYRYPKPGGGVFVRASLNPTYVHALRALFLKGFLSWVGAASAMHSEQAKPLIVTTRETAPQTGS